MRVRTALAATSALALLTGGVALAAGPATAGDGGRPFTVALSGAAEVPGPGDPDGTGTAVLRVNPGKGTVCYDITVADVQPLVMGHIHEASATASGPVVVGLFGNGGPLAGCVEVDRELAKEIIRTPSDYYVNVHNTEFPAGALRGQIGR